MSSTDGVLQGLTSGLVDQRESRAPLFILHPRAVLLILIPMLVLIGGIGGSENDLAATNGEREIGISFGENPDSGFGRETTGVNLVAHVMNSGGGCVVVGGESGMGGVVVGLVSHVVHGGTAASVSGVISCSGSRWVSVGEGVMMTIMMMVGRGWRRGSGVVVEVMGHVSWCHVSGMEHVGLRLRGWWLRDAVERRWRVAEGVSRRRVNGGSFVVVVVPAVVGVGGVRVVEGERHGLALRFGI